MLTVTEVKNAKAQDKAIKLPDAGGLYLLVKPSGSKLWHYRFWLHDKEGLASLGQFPDIGLAEARERHAAARKLVANGINPVHAQRQAKLEATQREQLAAQGTFGAVCASWRALTDPELKASSVRQRERELDNDVLPVLRRRQVKSITRLELVAMLHTIQQRAPETARNVRTHLDAIFEHACNTGLLSANPTPPRSILKKRQQNGHAAIAVDRVGDFLRAVDAAGMNPETRIAMLLVLLCASRKEEVIGAPWSEFDIEGGLWLIPANRIKGKRDHLVPLPRQAVALLRELRAITPPERTYLFPNRRDPQRPMANRSLNAVMERLGFNGEATVHGWRSVFSTRYNELGVNADVIERCLAHVHGNYTRAAYNRAEYLDQRRKLLAQWADWLDKQRAKKPTSKK
ncbi:integrase arm-type DNA-binding domain-containing protein [Bradyrhizobium sp. AUGA SZCCT0160]|uniref:tyrosine-type recombinase/integrase n=1 Tax=Bradyrhizobium sp. AUGA SZCCT0160 TaxID=2807662 RepID=UPI001BA909EC|nr:integrase arm-type DNA-binding domain-containing protein [Bradyrhizobium sp. AUGA SZCCT0160]MBR1193977.1 tyrosine-type recombinase/integrase [Bradyrhizobium sp. AUGA SZCCT0160]